MMSVKHHINRRYWHNGRPWKRTTWAQLRAKERQMIKRERQLSAVARGTKP